MRSLFIQLKDKGLTSLRIQYNLKTGKVRLPTAKECNQIVYGDKDLIEFS